MATTPNYADKIAGLLAKAESTDSPHEAEALTAKAEALMVKWGISDAQLDEKRRKGKKAGEKIIERKILVEGSWARGLIHIGFAVGAGLGNVRVLKSSVPGSSMSQRLWFVGHESDVERAVTLYNSLVLQALSAREHWWKTTDEKQGMTANEKFLAKRQFLVSFGWAVQSRLTATRNEAVKDAGTGTELVLVDRGKKVDDWIDSHYKVGKGKSTRTSSAGSAAGHAAGQKANLNSTSVGTGKAGAIGS